jgi:hypothetical protein
MIAPGCPVNELEVIRTLRVRIFNLNDQIDKGAMAHLSRNCAAFIRAALHEIGLPPEAVSSQGDLYQYHLRKQYLFYTALKNFFDSGFVDLTQLTLVFPFARMVHYESPMRPELDKLFYDFRTFGYLAQQLGDDHKIKFEFYCDSFPLMTKMADAIILPARQMILQTYAIFKLVKKVCLAKRPNLGCAATVGIIVRTDSEVISAAALIDVLEAANISVMIIQDELLASETTVQRLDDLKLNYRAIGSQLGLTGLFNSLLRTPSPARKDIAALIAKNLDSVELFMGIGRYQWAEWMSDRLFDFFRMQRHFGAELRALIRAHDLQLLITFAYVDQWGPIIQHTGTLEGIPTVCVQNAAQDPEEFPRLAWADHYCVESQYLKSTLIALGYPSDRITATGLPHYTEGLRSNQSLMPTTQKRSILVITQPIYQEYYLELLQWLAPFCAENNYELHVKYHPRQSGNEYADVLEKAARDCPVVVFHRENIDSALCEAKLCISIVSAAIIRAINIGIPTISFLPKSEKYLDLYYCSEENVFVAETLEDIGVILTQATKDFPSFWCDFLNRRQHYLANHLATEPTGDSANNIFGIIRDQLSQKK